MFEKAIELGPKHSDAYARMGSVQGWDVASQWSHDPHGLDRAIQLEQQSIALDNSNALAYAMVSTILLIKREYDLSITAAERAVALEPNFAIGYNALALALSDSGKLAEALVAVHKAMRLDPQMQPAFSFVEGRTYMLMGRYEEAIPVLKRYLAGNFNFIVARVCLIACYVELGRNAEARAEAAEVIRINPQFPLAVKNQRPHPNEPLLHTLYPAMPTP